jgi:hypothetical protein
LGLLHCRNETTDEGGKELDVGIADTFVSRCLNRHGLIQVWRLSGTERVGAFESARSAIARSTNSRRDRGHSLLRM